jgi:phytoene dehydrogenase-like protein
MSPDIAVVGGGLTGLACAIRLAERGYAVHLYEAAPELGGRTRSYFDKTMHAWVDHGPHLLIGAYAATRQLLHDAGATDSITWQHHLELPLWDAARGTFRLQAPAALPLAFGLPLAVYRLPGHTHASALAMLRLGLAIRGRVSGSVAELMQRCRIPAALQRDLIEPLCLGSMNAAMDEADAASFAEVLRQAFASHAHARLGWFNKPLQQALIQPLAEYAIRLGVHIHTGCRVQGLASDDKQCILTFKQEACSFRRVVLALPPLLRNQLLGVQQPLQSRPITNVHLWLKENPQLPDSMVGGIGTYGQWFFDISAQMGERDAPYHICAVISADAAGQSNEVRLQQVTKELQQITGHAAHEIVHHRIVQVRHATTLVSGLSRPALPDHVIDACEQPRPGELPATIETAIQRGETAARTIILAA